MRKPDAYPCPGCGNAIATPERINEERGWLLPDAWCTECGGTATRLGILRYGPRWYNHVAEEFDKISVMELVADPENVSPFYEAARDGAEATVDNAYDEESIEREAAERAALAIAICAYGPGFIKAGPPETLAEIESDYMRKLPLTPEQRDNYIDSGLDEETWRKRNLTRTIHVVAWRHRTPGEGHGGVEWDDDKAMARVRAGSIGVYADKNYETWEFTMDVPAEWERHQVTERVDEEAWTAWPKRRRKAVDLVREAYFLDPTISNEEYGRLMEEADEMDEYREWAAEAASTQEE